jgi:hypothetical protein
MMRLGCGMAEYDEDRRRSMTASEIKTRAFTV